MGHCNLCDEGIPDAELVEHIRVLHPDDYGDGVERWPDGSVVFIDQTDYTADEIGGDS